MGNGLKFRWAKCFEPRVDKVQTGQTSGRFAIIILYFFIRNKHTYKKGGREREGGYIDHFLTPQHTTCAL